MKVIILLFMGILMWPASADAIAVSNADELIAPLDTVLPKAFVIGEYEKEFESLNLKHSKTLLEGCDDDMKVAFDKWMSMIKEMEAYATIIGYDLKGVKTWLNVFWQNDGQIAHIAFYLKPNSKNVDILELTAFFSSFMNHYSFPLVIDVDYSHYGGASFPTFSRASSGTNSETRPLVKDSSKH